MRKEKSKPILDAFLCWSKKQSIASKSKLGCSITYLKNNSKYLRRYLEYGRLEIDNNRVERGIKSLVIGRKNFLFANTESGANGSTIMYSIIETAKDNNLNPFKYLTYIFTKFPNLKNDETIDILLLWNAPDECRAKI